MFVLWLLFGDCGRAGAGAGAPALPAPVPGGEPGWPGSPISYTPPWPAAVPTTGLPKFPGSGWEFDEPPPAAVQQRARMLVDVLWKQGSGTSRIEQTAGRWIAYQAQVVSSGRKGVVAYRLKRAQLPAGSSTATASRAPAQRPTPQVPPSPAPSASSSPAARPRPVSVRVGPAVVEPATVKPVSVSPVSLPTLVKGAGIKPKPPSANVKLLQQRLGIPADGQFWTDTDKAVRAFQAAHGLDVDGIVGDKTWTALFASGRA